MILQALVKRYEDVSGTKPGWQERAVDYAVNLNSRGEVLERINLESTQGKSKRKMMNLPEEPAGRTSGIKAAFLCDNGGYIFGADEKRGKEKFAAAKELHEAVLKNIDTPVAKAILAFFENSHEVPLELVEVKGETQKLKNNTNCVFMVEGEYTNKDLTIREAWDEYLDCTQAGEMVTDLVSGDMDILAQLHGKVKLPGVSMSAVPLVSINSESFASYGKTANDPAAQIGSKTAFAYVTALNELLASPDHHQSLGGDTLVYWAEGGGENEAKAFSWTSRPEESDDEKLDSIMKKYASGGSINIEGCKMNSKFYILCMSPNAGRISIRFFYQNTFENIIENIVKHYCDLEIITPKNEKFRVLPPWIILSETTVKKKASDAAPLLGGQLLQSIISGSAYPRTLFNAIITRCKANENINRTKAAIIKAALIRAERDNNNYKEKNESEVTTVALNEQSENTPYVLGRLFSLLEYMQQRSADVKLNATIRDKYFASACANPKSVFPTLLKLSMHHLRKLNEKNKVYFEKQKTELLEKLDEADAFPNALALEDQGRFILGYYHQTQKNYTSNKSEEEENDE